MITVIMGVSSIGDYLIPAIKSILDQTFHDFEFLIIANGPTHEEIAHYISQNITDHRIVLLKSKIPQLAYALNLGLDHAKYDLIARMDADDISEPNRLERLLDFLMANDLDLVGSDVTLIDEQGRIIGKREATKGAAIDKWLPFRTCFIHPTVLYRKETVFKVRGYNSGFNSEDYDLWLRMKRMGVRWDNLSEPLLRYRIHGQASQRKLLGYAEAAGYSLREFILKKSFRNFLAIFVNFAKSIIRPR